MSRRLIVRPEAESDIADAMGWYEGRQPGLGAELIEEIKVAMAKAADNPLIYTRVRARPETRRILSRRFPYRIFYIVREETVVVFAVLHAARHDRIWKVRATQE